jgi:hypothetical protein
MRVSFERLEKLAESLRYKIYRSQELGKGENYYYYYTLYKNGEFKKGSRSTGELRNYLLESQEAKNIIGEI